MSFCVIWYQVAISFLYILQWLTKYFLIPNNLAKLKLAPWIVPRNRLVTSAAQKPLSDKVKQHPETMKITMFSTKCRSKAVFKGSPMYSTLLQSKLVITKAGTTVVRSDQQGKVYIYERSIKKQRQNLDVQWRAIKNGAGQLCFTLLKYTDCIKADHNDGLNEGWPKRIICSAGLLWSNYPHLPAKRNIPVNAFYFLHYWLINYLFYSFLITNSVQKHGF